MYIASGSSNPEFAASLAVHLKIPQLTVESTQFANGELRVRIEGKELRGEDVILVQSFAPDVNNAIVEATMLLDALERAGCRTIYLVCPWLGYSLQDKVFRPGESLSAKVIARLLSAGDHVRVFLMDVHNPSVTAFFDVPTDHLTAMPVFVEYCRNAFELGSCVVASPDFGGLKRARLFADALDVPLVNLEKSRNLQSGKIEEMELHGDVRGKNVVVYDDLINTGSTIVAVTASLRAAGAKSVHFCATHALLVGNATQNIVDSHIDSIIVTNTIAHHALPPSIKVLDCSGVFARALQPWLAK